MRGLLRDRLFKKHYNKLIQSRSKKGHKTSINTISSITILATTKDHSIEALEKAPKYFRKMGITCEIYVLKGKKEHFDIIPEFNIIDREECMWYGIPSQEILIHWLEKKTDLLIFSDVAQEPLMKYLCAASNSKLKSSFTYKGYEQDDLDIDLWIDIKEAEEQSLIKQCKMTYKTLLNIGIRPPVIG